jgi:predicted NBD/HSP70 family sugar kinase
MQHPHFATNGTQSTILQAVRDHQPVSRSGIVQRTGLPHAATSRTVAALLEKEILREIPYADTSGPRRKRGLELNPARGYCVAVEYGPHKLEAVALNTAYEQIASAEKPVDLRPLSRARKLNAIRKFLRNFLNTPELQGREPLRIALADPGMVNPERGMTIETSLLDHWRGVPMVDNFEREFKCPVLLINGAMARIRAVDRLEVPGNIPNILFIEYGDGIGCGLKLAGVYIEGASYLAGELGHMRVSGKKVSCRCGGSGCLEAMAALPGLARAYRSIASDKKTLTGLEVLRLYNEGDHKAEKVVDEAFEYLARSVGGMINIINPEVLVLDQQLAAGGDRLIPAFLEKVERKTLPAHWKALDIRVSCIGALLGALGAAAAALDRCLEV